MTKQWINLAEAESRATASPIAMGFALTTRVALKATGRFENPVKGMRFRLNDNSTMPSISYKVAVVIAPSKGWIVIALSNEGVFDSFLFQISDIHGRQ